MTCAVLNSEMTLMQEADLSPVLILKCATSNAAATMQMTHLLESIEVGQSADLVLVSQNPLDDVRHTEQPVAVLKAL